LPSLEPLADLPEPRGIPTLPADSDERSSLAELLRRSARGDETAFAELYDATSARVFGLVRRIIRNDAIAEDVTQEAYLHVWQTAARYDEAKGSAMSWLMTLAHRRAVDQIRSTEAFSRRDTAYHLDAPRVEHDVTAAEASIEAKRVRVALESLSPVQRWVLELAYFEGRTHVEIAQITGAPLGTTKTRIRDGLIRLRDLVDSSA
jgi:RNA polymerase sigma-70 factor (ECF subfamily)